MSSNVRQAADGISKGIFSVMTEGQVSVTVSSNDVLCTCSKPLVTSVTSSFQLSPPSPLQIDEGDDNNEQLPRIQLTGNSLQACGFGGDYAQLSALRYGSNPIQNSEDVKSPLLRFLAVIPPSISGKIQSVPPVNPPTNMDGLIPSYELPAYYVTLPLIATQSFNFDAFYNNRTDKNYTLPICSVFNGKSYVNCGNCKISSYSNTNVTFGCFDVENICPSPQKRIRSRRLRRSSNNGDDVTQDDIIQDDVLGDDITADDDGGPRFIPQSAGTTFAALFESIGAEFKDVLSLNLNTIDLDKGTPVFILTGCLIFCIIAGVIFFLKWDKLDRHKAVYLREYEMKALRDKIEDDLRIGGSGAIMELQKAKDSIVFESLTSLINRNKKQNKGVIKGAIEMKKENIIASPAIVNDIDIKETDVIENDNINYQNEKKILDDSHHMDIPTISAEFTNIILESEVSKQAENFEKGKKLVTFSEIMVIVLKEHYFTSMWMDASLCRTRVIRFLECMKMVLLSVFIDTLIFGIFFPSDNRCSIHFDKRNSIAEQSKVISGSSICYWSDNNCQVRQAPTDLVFILIIGLLITILMRPCEVIVSYLLMTMCAKRPNLKRWKMNINSWMGSVISDDKTKFFAVALSRKSQMVNYRSRRKKVNFRLTTEEKEKQSGQFGDVEQGFENEINYHTSDTYLTLASPHEEMARLLETAQNTLKKRYLLKSTPDYYGGIFEKNHGKEKEANRNVDDYHFNLAIEEQLMIYPDGTLKALTVWQKLRYGDRVNYVMAHLDHTRRKAEDIHHKLERSDITDGIRDIMLIRHFIEERVAFRNKFSLKSRLRGIEGLPPELIHPLLWILGWLLVISIYLFFLYW